MRVWLRSKAGAGRAGAAGDTPPDASMTLVRGVDSSAQVPWSNPTFFNDVHHLMVHHLMARHLMVRYI